MSVTPAPVSKQPGEDTAHVSGDRGTLALGVRKDAAGTLAGTDGDYAPPQFDADGNLRVNIAAGSSSGTEYTDGDAVATPDGSVALGHDGSNVRAITTDSDGDLQVDVKTSALPTGAATLAEQQTQTASLSVLDDWDESDRCKVNAAGSIADDSTTPNNPVMIGGTAKSPDGTDPSSVSAENDVTRAITDLNRRLFVNTRHPRALHKHLDGSSAYTDEAVAADPGDGFQIVITHIQVCTGAATALNFFLEEGSTKIFGPVYLEAVAGRGYVSGPIYLPVTASTAVTITTSAAIAQSVDIDYFIQAV